MTKEGYGIYGWGLIGYDGMVVCMDVRWYRSRGNGIDEVSDVMQLRNLRARGQRCISNSRVLMQTLVS